MRSLRIGVIADPHVALEEREGGSWHNPFHLADSLARLRAAVQDPWLQPCDLLVVLGDVAHWGDAPTMRAVIRAVADTRRPVLVLSGNHDVLVPGVRLAEQIRSVGAPLVTNPGAGLAGPATTLLGEAGFAVEVHEVTALTERDSTPFDVQVSRVGTGDEPAGVVLSHFPVLSLESECADAGLRYAGHLDQLAPIPAIPRRPACPTVILAGHLHLRGVAVEGELLQVVFAALVEPPFDISRVELSVGPAGPTVSYESRPMQPSTARLPVLAPPSGSWTWSVDRWAAVDRDPELT